MAGGDIKDDIKGNNKDRNKGNNKDRNKGDNKDRLRIKTAFYIQILFGEHSQKYLRTFPESSLDIQILFSICLRKKT